LKMVKKKSIPQRKKRVFALRWKNYVKRLCKKKNIPFLPQQAMEVVVSNIDNCLENILKQAGVLMVNKKTFTQNTAKTAFIGLLSEQGVDQKTMKDILKTSEDAIAKLESAGKTK